MGGPTLPAATPAQGARVDPLTCRELYGHIVQACAASTLVTGIELLVLEAPVLKLRAHVGTLAFIEVFFNEETGKTSFA